MAESFDDYQLPKLALFEGTIETYQDWKFTLFLHLDLLQLARLSKGPRSSRPPANATDEERFAYKCKKIRAYTILRRSVYDWMYHICIRDLGPLGPYSDGGAPLEFAALFDNNYDAKRLWDFVHEMIVSFDPDTDFC